MRDADPMVSAGSGYWTHVTDGSLPLAQLVSSFPWVLPRYIHTYNTTGGLKKIGRVLPFPKLQSLGKTLLLQRVDYNKVLFGVISDKQVRMSPSTRLIFSHPSSRIALIYQSFCSRTIVDQL